MWSLLAEVCDAALHRIDKALHKLDSGLHKLALDGEEEERRMKRRLHIHLCLIGVSGALSICAAFDIVSLTVAAGASLPLMGIQEWIDEIGRF